MKKIFLLVLIIFLSAGNGYSTTSSEAMKKSIETSQIKTPAVVRKVSTIQNSNGYRIQQVEFEGLYYNSGKKYSAKCHNYKRVPRTTSADYGVRRYNPQSGQRVFVTIDKNKGEITSMIIMDKDFEQNLVNSPKNIKYDSDGAFFEE